MHSSGTTFQGTPGRSSASREATDTLFNPKQQEQDSDTVNRMLGLAFGLFCTLKSIADFSTNIIPSLHKQHLQNHSHCAIRIWFHWNDADLRK